MLAPSVIWRRNACGAVDSLEIHSGEVLLLDTAADEDPEAALSFLLHLARDYYRADPHAGHLPPDHAIIAAWEDHLS
jgi:hypothetical protein